MSIEILSNLVITKVHSVSTMYSPLGAKSRRVNRAAWAVVMKYEGETVYESGKKRFLSDINHVAILPKGCSYAWECTKAGYFSIIDFECDASHPEPIIIPTMHGERILKMLRELEYKRNLGGAMQGAESIRDTYSIILTAIGSPLDKYVTDDKRQIIMRAVEYISQSPAEDITNDTLASVCGMSTVYFRKLFRQIMGISPMAYAKQLRIEKAKEMLSTDYGTLTSVAHSLGYSGLYDFSRDFKKHTGVPPSKYGRGLHKE